VDVKDFWSIKDFDSIDFMGGLFSIIGRSHFFGQIYAWAVQLWNVEACEEQNTKECDENSGRLLADCIFMGGSNYLWADQINYLWADALSLTELINIMEKPLLKLASGVACRPDKNCLTGIFSLTTENYLPLGIFLIFMLHSHEIPRDSRDILAVCSRYPRRNFRENSSGKNNTNSWLRE
jgi:hypothetical protein